MTDITDEINLITAGRPELAFPHTLAQRISRGEWKPFPYLVEISKTLVKQIVIGNGRILVTLPCGHGKTELIVIYFIVFYLNLYPRKNIIFSTHTESFGQSLARKIRNIILGNKNSLTLRLAQDSKSTERFHTPQGGGLVVASIGSGFNRTSC